MNSFMSEKALEKKFEPIVAGLKAQRLVPVIRTDTPEEALWASEILVEAGARVLEITNTVPQAEHVIETLSKRYPDLLLGAGTIFDRASAQRVLQAGAQFIVSPVLDENLLDFGRQEWTLVIPGVMTPSEVHHARILGATLIKIFPAHALGGPAYVKSLLSVMPTLQLIPTGGIRDQDIPAYLEAGALCVGLGQNLIPKEYLRHRDRLSLLRHLEGAFSREGSEP